MRSVFSFCLVLPLLAASPAFAQTLPSPKLVTLPPEDDSARPATTAYSDAATAVEKAADAAASSFTAPGGTVARSESDHAADWRSIRDFSPGAKCDGTTDDYTALAAAMTYAGAHPGSAIFFPPSPTPCMTSQSIIVPTATTLWAVPGTATIKPLPANASSILLLSFANFASDATVYGLVLDGGGQDFGNSAPLIQAYKVSRVTFDSVRVQHTRGMVLNGSSSNRVGFRNSAFVDIGNHWKTTASASDRIAGVSFCCGDHVAWGYDNFVQNSYFEDIGLDAINATDEDRLLLTGNRFNLASNQVSVVTAADYPAAIYCVNGDVVITGNRVLGAAGNGIDTVACTATITGNTVTKSGSAGILLTASPAATVAGNTLLDNNQQLTGANGNLLGGLSFCGALGNVTIAGNRIGNTSGSAQTYGLYAHPIGSCATATFGSLWADQSNDFSGNAAGTIGGGNAALVIAQPKAATTAALQPGTPATSSASCTPNQTSADANHLYLCTAANTWKRATLRSF
jgi:parallel beta-helix repeat protein